MSLSVVVLAAGLGTRMKSSIPKVIHELNGKPMISCVIESVTELKPENIVVVVGPDSEGIKKALGGLPVTFAVQKEPKGTGDALKAATAKLKGAGGDIMILSGDTPLIAPSTLKGFLKLHRREKQDLSIISFVAEGSHSYGRIVRENDMVKAIIEDRDADINQKKIQEVNSGIYLIKASLLGLLKEIRINSSKGEYYLTDMVGIAVKKGLKVGAHMLGDEMELTGINTRTDLYKASCYLRAKTISGLMERGVSFLDTASVFIQPGVKIGTDTFIYPNVHIEGNTVIGNNCRIYPNTRIVDSVIGDNVLIKDSTVIESSTVREKASVGPFTHIRPGSVIGPSAKIGNFVEIKKSVIGRGTKASHLSYLGDAEIGMDVNIGAGTITCNYDGEKKHKTIIEDNVFIGSDTQLVAPVKIKKGSYVGAGSTITKDVPPFSLAVSRAEQRNLENWALRKKKKAE